MKPRHRSITFEDEEYLRRIQPYWQDYQRALDRLNIRPSKGDDLEFHYESYRRFAEQCGRVIRMMNLIGKKEKEGVGEHPR